MVPTEEAVLGFQAKLNEQELEQTETLGVPFLKIQNPKELLKSNLALWST